MRSTLILCSLLLILVACREAPEIETVTSHAEVETPQKVTHEELKHLIAETDAEAVVVNYWASWCVPCKEEFPELVRFGREYAEEGVKILFVTVDFDEDVPLAEAFLQEQGVTYPTYQKTGKDMEFIEAMHPDWSGVVPATFVYDREGNLHQFWQEKISYEQLEASVKQILS